MFDKKKYLAFVIPSIFAFALSGVYTIVDGFFVGNRIGEAGLSTSSMVYPVAAFIQAIGTGIGMGGAVRYSVTSGEGKKKVSKEYVAAALWMLLATSVFLTFLLCTFLTPILNMLGADGILARLLEHQKLSL